MSNLSLPTVDSFLDDIRAQMLTWLTSRGFRLPKSVVDATDEVVCAVYRVQQRTIPPAIRRVSWSTELQSRIQRDLTPSQRLALHTIEAEMLSGADMNMRLTRHLWRAKFNDRLMTDWRIQHLHLGVRAAEASEFVEGMKELLFAIVTDADAYFIDLRDHDSFAERELLNIVDRNWPQLLDPFRIGQADGGEAPRPDASHAALRQAGFVAAVQLDGGSILLPPSGGYMMDGTALSAARSSDDLLNAVVRCHRWLMANANSLAERIGVMLGKTPDNLDLHVVFDGSALHLHERTNDFWIVPHTGAIARVSPNTRETAQLTVGSDSHHRSAARPSAALLAQDGCSSTERSVGWPSNCS